jgi:hypothetical protein
MSRISQKVELIANVTIIVAAVLIAGVVAQKYFFPRTRPMAPARIQPDVGARMNLPDVNWSRQPKTLILALQTGCHFCDESVPFYKRVAENVKAENVKVIAAFPTGVEESAAHLKALGLTNIEVRQLPLESLQTSGTPTLILTNDKGEITNYWLGKLTPDKEAQVLQKITEGTRS